MGVGSSRKWTNSSTGSAALGRVDSSTAGFWGDQQLEHDMVPDFTWSSILCQQMLASVWYINKQVTFSKMLREDDS